MTIIPPGLQQPLQKFDRVAGPVIFLLGLFLFSAVTVWVGLYLNERTLGLFLSEWWVWLPVCGFLIPAIHMTYYGKEMMLGRGVPLLTYFETLAILIGLTIIGLIGFD